MRNILLLMLRLACLLSSAHADIYSTGFMMADKLADSFSFDASTNNPEEST